MPSLCRQMTHRVHLRAGWLSTAPSAGSGPAAARPTFLGSFLAGKANSYSWENGLKLVILALRIYSLFRVWTNPTKSRICRFTCSCSGSHFSVWLLLQPIPHRERPPFLLSRRMESLTGTSETLALCTRGGEVQDTSKACEPSVWLSLCCLYHHPKQNRSQACWILGQFFPRWVECGLGEENLTPYLESGWHLLGCGHGWKQNVRAAVIQHRAWTIVISPRTGLKSLTQNNQIIWDF